MTEVFSDNIFVMLDGLVLSTDSRHTYGYNMCSSSSRRLVPLLLFRHQTGATTKKKEKTFVPSLNFTLHYTDDVISLYNSMLCDFIVRIYPIELVINDIPYTDRSASFLDLHIEIDSDDQ